MVTFEFVEKTTKLALEQLDTFLLKTQAASHMKSAVMNDRISEVDSIISILNSVKAQLKARRHDK